MYLMVVKEIGDFARKKKRGVRRGISTPWVYVFNDAYKDICSLYYASLEELLS